jgi:PadR family transcriptional regulator, regulatory protein PadR
MAGGDVDVLQGTLDMLVLKALTWGPMHGYSILAWLRRTTDERLRLEDAALYPALHRMEARGLIGAEWGVSENNRKAKFYRLTTKGRRELRNEAESWDRYVSVIAKIMGAAEQTA